MARLARFWDSLENDHIFEVTSPSTRKTQPISTHQKWLSSLENYRDDESSTILYAKPLLNQSGEMFSHFHDPNYVGPQKIRIRACNPMLSTSLGNLNAPPPKPQRRIARLRSSLADPFVASLPELNEDDGAMNQEERQQLQKTKNMPNLERIRQLKLPGFNGNVESSIASSSSSLRGQPPSYEQVQIARRTSQVFKGRPVVTCYNKNGGGLAVRAESFCGNQKQRPKMENRSSEPRCSHLCQSTEALNIRIGAAVEDTKSTKIMSKSNGSPRMLKRQMMMIRSEADVARREELQMQSPTSTRSDSSSSVDSGQCSGDVILCEQRSLYSTRQDSREDDELMKPSQTVPSYARMASTMDHVLRTTSALYTLLAAPLDHSMCRELLAKTAVLIQLLEASPCAPSLSRTDLHTLRIHVAELQKNGEKDINVASINNHFAIQLRRVVEQVLHVFVKIICKYISECGSKDRLVSISLEHLIHICLFGDELCIEAVQKNCINSCVRLVSQPDTPEHSKRFLLRTIAVLCGVSKGVLALLSQNGLELTLHHLLNSSSSQCSVEAAGIITQLTSPQQSFVRLTNIPPILVKLLDLVDNCSTGDSMLLVTAALNNVTLHHPNAVDMLYKNNVIRRLILAYNRDTCSTIFVQEQIVTTFSRLAAKRLEEPLIKSGATPVLLEMLSLTHPIHTDYCRRIRYKAAVCIGTLASTPIGLKSLHDNQAYAILNNVLCEDPSRANPFNMICTNIRRQIEAAYQNESAV